MIIFRNFARKAAKKIINPLEQPYSLQKSNPLEQSDPLVDEFQKFIDKELSHGVASEETVFKNILGNKNLETIIRAIEAGQEIDLEKISVFNKIIRNNLNLYFYEANICFFNDSFKLEIYEDDFSAFRRIYAFLKFSLSKIIGIPSSALHICKTVSRITLEILLISHSVN